MIFVSKNVSEPSNPPDELAQNVSKKNPFQTNYSSIFSAKVQNLAVFSIIYMIRIRFFGPGELIQNYFSGAQYTTVYVKMINGKTISIRYLRNMTAAVISDEVERRSLIPRDMIRLVHKGKMLNEKKTMKENNFEAKATIEMSLRLL